jgi:hypothetical protein
MHTYETAPHPRNFWVTSESRRDRLSPGGDANHAGGGGGLSVPSDVFPVAKSGSMRDIHAFRVERVTSCPRLGGLAGLYCMWVCGCVGVWVWVWVEGVWDEGHGGCSRDFDRAPNDPVGRTCRVGSAHHRILSMRRSPKRTLPPLPQHTHSSFPIPHPASVSARGKFPAGGTGGCVVMYVYIKDLKVPFHSLLLFFLLPSCCLVIVHLSDQDHRPSNPSESNIQTYVHPLPTSRPIVQYHGSMHM